MKSEFRQDLVSGEWVLIATERSKKPHSVLKREDNYQMIQTCPFENPQKSGNGEAVLTYPEDGNDKWKIQVITNRYPAVEPGVCAPIANVGGYNIMQGNGFHEVVVLKDHDRSLADFSHEEVTDLLKVYRARYREISKYDCADYIIIFHNYGHEAGATLYHPHSQIISLPILPPDVYNSLRGAEDYYAKFRKEVYEVMINRELQEKTRMVYSNEFCVSFCPFVSRVPYEVRIYPRRHSHRFEESDDNELAYAADVLLTVIRKLKRGLNDPAYNFFIHTSPVRENARDHSCSDFYRWHIEITPRVKFAAGFEAGTGIELNIVDPDHAAQILRDAHVQ